MREMRYTDTELEQLLNRLVASTRTPRGRFAAANSYKLLEKRLPGKRSFPLVRWIGAAAAMVALCVAGWFVADYAQTDSLQTIYTQAEVRTISLPDGTEVTLNHFSSLTYPKRFQQQERTVSLCGEAYFEVRKDTKHPFVVQTDAVDIRVLGTQFNVKAYANIPEIKTTLFEGSVAVSDKNQSERIVLRPNESAIYNKVEGSLTLVPSSNVSNDIAWQNGMLIFNNLPLIEIAHQLSNTFGIPIRIADKALQEYRITARFEQKDGLIPILRLLQHAKSFNYIEKNKEIILSAP